MERRLRNDMAQEAAVWGGRVMLHAEVPPAALGAAPANGAPSGTSTAAASNGDGKPQQQRQPAAQRQQQQTPFRQQNGAGAKIPAYLPDKLRLRGPTRCV